jgi:hypothetical protein
MNSVLNNNKTSIGYMLYAIETIKDRFVCGIIRISCLDQKYNLIKLSVPNASIKHKILIQNIFTEKIMLFLLKERAIRINNETFDFNIDELKYIFDICEHIDKIIDQKELSLEEIMNSIKNIIIYKESENNDPEVPIVRKAKRAIEQVNPTTKEVLANYESIEAAGRALGLTSGSGIGISLRNHTLCKGFLWRYAGISQEDQYACQPVIKICCKTGIHTNFSTIADAAKDCKISAPGLRKRILTNVHINDHHWIFDKNSTHYT